MSPWSPSLIQPVMNCIHMELLFRFWMTFFNISRESDFDFKTTHMHTHLLEIVLFGSYICYQIGNYVNNRYFNLDRCTFVKKILGELCCKGNILHYNKTALEGKVSTAVCVFFLISQGRMMTCKS